MRAWYFGSTSGITACMASCSPRPITWEASKSPGTGKPRSLAAAWIHCTMVEVLSIKVPSQSKTIRSNCFLAMFPDGTNAGSLSGERWRGYLVSSHAIAMLTGLTGGDGQRFAQAYQETLAFGGQRRLQGHALARFRVGERDLMGVQEHALEGATRAVGLQQGAVEGKIAVFIVASDGEARRRQVDADLMRAAGLQFRFQQGEVVIFIQQCKHRVRWQAIGLHSHPALAFGRRIFMQRQLHMLARIFPVARHHHQITLVRHTVAHLLMQIGQGSSLLCQ